MKIIRTAIISVIMICTLVCCTLISLGANSDYLNEGKWERAAEVKTVTLNKKSINNRLGGYASYICDNDILAMYNRFSFSESSMQYDGSDDVRVQYEVTAKEGIYTFAVTKDGIDDEFGESQNVFDVGYNFYCEGKTGKALTYFQYNGDSTSINIRVYLFANNCRYLVLNSVKMKIPEKTTVKKTTTKKAKKKKKKSSKKSKSNSRAKSSYNSAESAGTTKFDMQFDDENNTKKAKTTKAKTTVNTDENTPVLSRSVMSNSSLILLICGIILIVVGALIIIYSVGYSKAKKQFKTVLPPTTENDENQE